MNWLLKTRIVDKYGTQSDFAQALRRPETVVSQVVRCRRTLNVNEQRRWADALEADVNSLFGKEPNHVEA